MYRLCFQRDFTARHFLVGGDWGPENQQHAHEYRLEWELRAPDLDRHGYLVDLIDVERALGAVLTRYEGALLNDLPEFAGQNPSLERFARALWERLDGTLGAPAAQAGAPAVRGAPASSVRLWENRQAWASYEPW